MNALFAGQATISNFLTPQRMHHAPIAEACSGRQTNLSTKWLKQYTDTLGIAPGKINADTRFSDLGADSLDTVEMVMELEENFDVNIPEDVAENMQTLGDVVRYIQEQRDRAG